MKAGPLDRRITFQRQQDDGTRNRLNQPVTSPAWIDVATVWAQIIHGEPVQEPAGEKNPRRSDHAPMQFRIRWRSDLLPTDRIVWEGAILRITGMTELGRRDGLMITATFFAPTPRPYP